MTEERPKRSHLDELKEHALELHEFEGPDWEGTREDSELLWNLREALSRSVEKGEPEATEPSEPAMESELQKSYELPAKDAELLLAELTDPLETNLDQKEKVENAERSL